MSSSFEKKSGPSPFDYSKSILNSNSPIDVAEGYVPYIVNRAVAHHRDCIYVCQLINEFHVEPEHQYTFLFYQINKYRRSFEKWVSSKNVKENLDDIEMISKYYKCSIDVAREYFALHTPESLAIIKASYGGKEL
jgi:hypothetical protein